MNYQKSSDQKNSPKSNATTKGYLPLGWTVFIFGILSMAASALGQFEVGPKTDFPIGGLGLALFVAGYIACFIIPSLDRRITALEDCVKDIEKKNEEKKRS